MDKEFSNYSEFVSALNNDTEDRFQVIIDYDDFQIIGEAGTGRYFYIECGENDASDFFEVKCIASLYYDINHDLKIDHADAGMYLSELFDCDMCGESVFDDHIEYLWFKRL